MIVCKFMVNCSMFNTDFSDVTKEVYRRTYCSDEDNTKCARRKLQTAGKMVPDYLLPSGKLAKELH